jgi:uncharacterized protein YjiK
MDDVAALHADAAALAPTSEVEQPGPAADVHVPQEPWQDPLGEGSVHHHPDLLDGDPSIPRPASRTPGAATADGASTTRFWPALLLDYPTWRDGESTTNAPVIDLLRFLTLWRLDGSVELSDQATLRRADTGARVTASDLPPARSAGENGQADSNPSDASHPTRSHDREAAAAPLGRYRTLGDALHLTRLDLERAEVNARFALVVLGALVVVPLFLATRAGVAGTIPEALRPWSGGYLVVHVVLGACFFFQAVESLRPQSRPRAAQRSNGGTGAGTAWRPEDEKHVAELNDELARQVQALARSHGARSAPLRRAFTGLRTMTVMATPVLVLAACSLLFEAPAPPRTGPAAIVVPPARPAAARLAVPRDTADPQHPAGADQRLLLGPAVLTGPERVPIDARQPTGVAFHAGLGHLFVVADDRRLLELDDEGRPVLSLQLDRRARDLVAHAPTGGLLLLDDEGAELAWFDARSGLTVTRWRLDVESILGQAPAQGSPGFQGLAFREVPGYPGGGVFYLVHQRGPAMIVTLSLDPSSSGGRLGGSAVAGRIQLEGEELTAASYAPALDRLLVVSDATDRGLVLRTDGTVEAEVVLPGRQQEGLAVDGEGGLWLADERGGLLRVRGALAALEKALAGDTGGNDL